MKWGDYYLQNAKTAQFTIYGRLSGLNEYTKACRCNRYAGAKLKAQNEEIVKYSILEEIKGVKFQKKVHITYKWYEKNGKRDVDNIAFAKKFINDALVDCEVLIDDSRKYLSGFTDEFYTDKENPRIEVFIREVE